MTKDIDKASPALAVFGLDASKKAHGSYFAESEVDRAIKAAMDAGLFALRVVGGELAALAAKLPRGKLFDSGSAFVPFVAMPVFQKLVSAGDAAGDALLRPAVLLADRPAKPKTKASSAPAAASKSERMPPGPYTVPSDWTTIAVGSLVLGADDPEDGYFKCVIVAVDDARTGAEREVILQFVEYPKYAQIRRRVGELGLLHRSVTGELPQQAK